MNKFKIAHIREQGQQMIIVPLGSDFDRQTENAQREALAALQAASTSAGLAGTVVPVWLSGNGMKFIAPRPWLAFFRSLHWNQIMASINKELTVH